VICSCCFLLSTYHRVVISSSLKAEIQLKVGPRQLEIPIPIILSRLFSETTPQMSDLIVDFPYKRNRRAVHFADKAELYIVARHENNNVARHELWYTKYEYYSMKHDIRDDVRRARSKAAQSPPFNNSVYDDDDDDDDDSSEEEKGFWIGIAHLLRPACMLEVRTCRARCVFAVLAKQAILSPSTRFRWEDIALASFAQTRKAVLRARTLGKLHQKAI